MPLKLCKVPFTLATRMVVSVVLVVFASPVFLNTHIGICHFKISANGKNHPNHRNHPPWRTARARTREGCPPWQAGAPPWHPRRGSR